MRVLLGAGLLSGGLCLLGAAPAHATVIDFGCITNNEAADCATGEAQLTVTVSDPGDDRVLFTFQNAGPDASSITSVHFDDGTLLGLSGLIDADDDALGSFGDPGVDFTGGSAEPPELPGADNVGFVTTAGFLADSDVPPPIEGVNPGESLGVVFELDTGGTVADVLAELADGTLRIGIFVQAFEAGGSESFVNVPEPGAALLLGVGCLGVAAARRRRG